MERVPALIIWGFPGCGKTAALRCAAAMFGFIGSENQTPSNMPNETTVAALWQLGNGLHRVPLMVNDVVYCKNVNEWKGFFRASYDKSGDMTIKWGLRRITSPIMCSSNKPWLGLPEAELDEQDFQRFIQIKFEDLELQSAAVNVIQVS